MDDKSLEGLLVATVHELFASPNRDELSVNNVRKTAEGNNGLEDGFFSSAEWKGKSKTIIKAKVVRYYPAWCCTCLALGGGGQVDRAVAVFGSMLASFFFSGGTRCLYFNGTAC